MNLNETERNEIPKEKLQEHVTQPEAKYLCFHFILILKGNPKKLVRLLLF